MSAAEAVAGVFANDPIDPYPLYRRILSARPPVSDDGRLAVVADAVSVGRVLTGPEFSVDRRHLARAVPGLGAPEGSPLRQMRQSALLFIDPPAHTRIRRLVGRAFSPPVIARFRPQVAALVDGLLAQGIESTIDGRETLEVVGRLARPLPVAMIETILGVPEADRAQMTAWSDALAGSLDVGAEESRPERVAAQQEALGNFRAYFAELAAARRRAPGDDLLSLMIAAVDDGDRLSEDELLSNAALLLVAGHETTTNLIATGAARLPTRRDVWSRLASEPAGAPPVVEELLRHEPPVQLTLRVAPEGADLGPLGRLAPGGVVLVLLAAAGRDPGLTPAAEDFDPGRTGVRHFAFGGGVHHCVGAALARLEAEVALAALAARLPTAQVSKVSWKPNRILRGPAAVELLSAAG